MTQSSDSDSLFARNLSFFRSRFPEVADAIERHGVDCKRLLRVGEDDWDIALEDGGRLYGKGARSYSIPHVDGFWTVVDRTRLNLTPPHTTGIAEDPDARGFMHSCLKRAIEGNVRFFERRCDNSAVNLVVLGCGLAQHLVPLVDRSECESVIIVEPRIDFFCLSLFVFDWGEFLGGTLTRGGRVNILLTDDPTIVAFTVMSTLNDWYPALIDGTLFYQHYDAPIFKAMWQEFATNYAPHTSAGFGFVEDELCMIENSVHNLERFDGRTFMQATGGADLPAFIVGSGPSFDQSIDTVRKFADRVLIISCGTGLQLLLGHGVTPDIHMELENAPEAHDVISRCMRDHHFRKTVLVASTTVDPRIPSLFDDTVFFFREGPSSYPVFNLGPESTVKNAFPLVSNLALSVTREIGCPEIYLFGIDLGTRDAAVHHSRESPYSWGELDYPFDNVIRIAANFGGVVLSNVFYMKSKHVKEFDIRENASASLFFNCSDGARIDGVSPLKATDVDIRDRGVSKDTVRRTLLDRFPCYDESAFSRQWRDRDVVSSLDAYTKRLCSALSRSGDGYVDVLRLLRQLNGMLSNQVSSQRSCETVLYRGTLSTAMAVAYFYLTRTGEARDRELFSRIIKEELYALIGRIEESVLGKYAELGHEIPSSG